MCCTPLAEVRSRRALLKIIRSNSLSNLKSLKIKSKLLKGTPKSPKGNQKLLKGISKSLKSRKDSLQPTRLLSFLRRRKRPRSVNGEEKKCINDSFTPQPSLPSTPPPALTLTTSPLLSASTASALHQPMAPSLETSYTPPPAIFASILSCGLILAFNSSLAVHIAMVSALGCYLCNCLQTGEWDFGSCFYGDGSDEDVGTVCAHYSEDLKMKNHCCGIEQSGSILGASATSRPLPKSGKSVAEPRNNGLDDLHLIYVNSLGSGERVPTNEQGFSIDDDFFVGKFLPMFRVADEPSEDDVEGRKTYTHFKGKKRMFEFQFQGRLKQRPEGKLWISLEFDRPLKIGSIQRMFLQGCLNFIRRTNKCFHYSFGDEDTAGNGTYEKPHVAFAMEYALDRLVVTKAGETPPAFGGATRDIDEPDVDASRRKKGVPGSFPGWNTDDIYTMSIWSAYVDFVTWRILNLPGIRSFLMSSIFGSKPINVVFYSMRESLGAIDKRPHFRKDLKIISHYEIGHRRHTQGGYTQKYMEQVDVIGRTHTQGGHTKGCMEQVDVMVTMGAVSGCTELRSASSTSKVATLEETCSIKLKEKSGRRRRWPFFPVLWRCVACSS